MDWNCPNCGAPKSGWKCEYCETVFERDRAEEIEEARKRLAIQKMEYQTAQQTAAILMSMKSLEIRMLPEEGVAVLPKRANLRRMNRDETLTFTVG